MAHDRRPLARIEQNVGLLGIVIVVLVSLGGLAEIKWICEFADLHGIAMAPHGTANGIFGLAALIQVSATMPDNLIAFEYPARFEPFWYDITEGFDGMPVKGGLIDVPDRPGLGVNFIPKEAKKYLSDGDADFFD